jgi:peptidoglycan glycosyltransferase
VNAPIRRVAFVVAVLFASLFISTTYVQVVDAKSLADKPTNTRTLYREYGRDRGPLLVSGAAIAESKASNDVWKYQRTYPGGKVYAPITGYYSLVYAPTALENTENGLLAGTADQLFYRNIRDVLTGEQPQGAQVRLTINAKAQEAAYKALGDQKGAVVAIEPKTGNILAMVSRPSYDPDQLATHDKADAVKAYKKLNNDDSEPLINRAISGNLYPPGSVFKMVVSAAALSDGYTPDSVIDAPSPYHLPGTGSATLSNDSNESCGPDNKTTLLHALTISCNTAYAKLGDTLGQQKIADQAQKFGFGQKLSIPLVVTPSTFPSGMNLANLAQASIGQYEDKVTPLQIAMVAAGIANKGVVMRPNLISKVTTAQLKVIEQSSPQELDQAITPDVASELTTMMESVVTSGTGTAAQIPGVDVAGKTGTAQNEPGAAPHAWFASFAPADDPKVAVAVVVEHGGKAGNEAYGGTVAAPIAKAVMEAVLNK